MLYFIWHLGSQFFSCLVTVSLTFLKFFNCVATCSLTFWLNVLQLPCCIVLDFGVVSTSFVVLHFSRPLVCKFFDWFDTQFIDLWIVSSSVALLQFPWPLDCKFSRFLLTISFTIGVKVLQLPCDSVFDIWVVSSSITLLQCHWPLGCKFFSSLIQYHWHLRCKFSNRVATISLTFWL